MSLHTELSLTGGQQQVFPYVWRRNRCARFSKALEPHNVCVIGGESWKAQGFMGYDSFGQALKSITGWNPGPLRK